MPSDKSWGEFLGIVIMVATIPHALTVGAFKALQGESFEDGCERVLDAAYDGAAKFGEKHGQLIEKTLVKAAVWTIVGAIGDLGHDLPGEQPPKGPDA